MGKLSMLPRIVAVGTAVPQWRYSQQQLLEMGGRDRTRDTFFLHSDIDFRHLYFEPGFKGQETMDEMLGRARRGAAELGGKAIRTCLERAGAAPSAVNFLATATCTVSLCPQLDTLFIRDLNLSPFTQTAHIGDTGCAAAMVAMQAAWNHLRAFPLHRAVAASVEICSAALYRDGSVEAALGEAIFADGSGAVCLSPEGAGFEVLGHKTLIRTEHIGLTGFDFPGGARRLVLSRDLPAVGAEVLADLVGALLQEHGLKQSDIRFWIVHSAGRKVLDHAGKRLGLEERDLQYSRKVFRNFGNMSSATVLFVLEEVMTSGGPQPGDLALMAAMGAGFAAEGALLRWVQ
jgi:3,5-dihydroxyphenylacetyl-CoA synthase